MTLKEESSKQLPDQAAIMKHRKEQMAVAGIEAAILERHSKAAIRYRSLSDDEIRSVLQD